MPIMTITDEAAMRICELLAKEEAKGARAIRIGVKTRGCSGNAYVVDYVQQSRSGDEIIHDKGVTVHVDAAAVLMLFGTQMDYKIDKFESGFVFHNPNEKGRCGCGESFHV